MAERTSKAIVEEQHQKNYKVICISIYRDDLERLDERVQALRERGFHRANRSALIRHALDTVDLANVPRGL